MIWHTSNNMKPRTRFAPSPTGLLHMGSVRTALYNYLFAKKHGGTFVLRIEDTDKERSKKEFEDNIMDGLSWLGLSHDEFYRQSENVATHTKHLEQMVASGKAYVSKETPKIEGGRTEVIRFKNPNTTVTFNDAIRGEISFDTTELGDFVIAKSLHEPLFHLAVVVDDFEEKITHVIRGEDHISNTPRQILIGQAIGAPIPLYAHLPIVLATDKTKLSKRKHGETASLEFYRAQGYLPEAILNFLALIGWNPGGNREVITLKELEQLFDIERVQKGGAIFNPEKLEWLNKEFLSRLPNTEVENIIKGELMKSGITLPNDVVMRLIPVIFERIHKSGDIAQMAADGEFSYYATQPDVGATELTWKDSSKEDTRVHLEKVIFLIKDVQDFSVLNVKEVIWPYAESVGRGNVLWPMRFALSGKDKSPDPFSLAYILGKDETIKRLTHAITQLS